MQVSIYRYPTLSNLLYIGSSKNTLNTIPKKVGRLDKMIVSIVLIIVMILVCASRIRSWRELPRIIFPEGVF
jgi:hypothetical protein